MDVKFKVTEPAKSEPIVFDIIFAEKVGGGIVKNCAYDLPVGVAISKDGYSIKCFQVVEDAASDATSIKIKKGSGIAVDDLISNGTVAVAATAVDSSTSEDYDIVTVSLGAAVTEGDKLFNALAAPVEAGYYDATSGTHGALKVVASDATTGQINLADVTPYKGSKTLAANDYVIWKDEVKLAPKYAPAFVLGESIPANSGDMLVKLVNGANVRKETILIADSVLALMPMIAAL